MADGVVKWQPRAVEKISFFSSPIHLSGHPAYRPSVTVDDKRFFGGRGVSLPTLL